MPADKATCFAAAGPLRLAVLGALSMLAAQAVHAQAKPDVAPSPEGTTPGVFDSAPQQERPRPAFLPGVRSALTYSNNLDLTSGTRSNNGTVLEVAPYLQAESNTPGLKYNVFYTLRAFRVLSPANEDLKRQALSSNWSVGLYENWLYFDGRANIANVVADIGRPISADPGGYGGNSREVRSLSLTPNIRGVLLGSMPYSARYTYGTASSAYNGASDTAPGTHAVSGDISGPERSGNSWNWNWSGEWQRRMFPGESLDRVYAAGSLRYQATPDLRLSGGINFERLDGYLARTNKNFGYGPFVGIDWQPIENFSIKADLSKRYYATVWQVKASLKSGMLSANLDASQSLQNSLDASTYLFDGSSLAGISGSTTPASTALVYQNLISGYGIPFSASLISDSEVLSRRILAGVGLKGARNSLSFSFLRLERDSQGLTRLTRGTNSNSTRGLPASSALSGQYVAAWTNTSISLAYQHQFDARSAFDMAISQFEIHSPLTGQEFRSRVRSLTVGLSTKLTPDVTAGIGARRSQQRLGGISSSYDESAVFGTVDVRF